MSTAPDRASLLEMDAPSAPRAPARRPAPVPAPSPAPAPVPVPEPAPVAPAPVPPSPVALPAHATVRMASNAEIAARNAQRPAQESAAPAPIPGSSTGSLGDALGTAVAEGQHLHAQRDLVRGGVTRPDVNRVAGYNTAVVAARGEVTRYADAARNVQLDPTAAPVATNTGHLKAGDVVAGATKVREGALVGWTGKGARTRGQLQAALVEAGLSTDWLPKVKSAHAHAGVLISGIGRDGMIAKAVETGGKTPEQRGWQAVWNVGRVGTLDAASSVPSEAVGRPFGSVAMVITLSNADTLTVDIGSNADLADLKASLVARFNARCAEEHYTAGDVTTWLGSVMHKRLGGIAYGPGSYYMQAANAERAEALCKAMKGARWGASWIVPALPIVNGERLRMGLVDALVDEAREVLLDYGKARDAAEKAGKSTIGEEKAGNLESRMRNVLEHAQGYAALLGDAAVANLRTAVRAAIAEIEPTLTIAASRFAGIWDDLRASGEVSDAVPVAIETSDAIPEPIGVSATAATVAVEAPAPSPVPVAVPTERAIVNPTERGPRRPPRSVPAAPVGASAPVAPTVDTMPTMARTDASMDIRKGRLVRVLRGRKVPLGTEGVVLRADVGQWGPRVCIKTATGEIHWSSPSNVECVVDDNGRPLYPAFPGTSAAQSA